MMSATSVISRRGLLRAVLYQDHNVIALNKWRSLSVQDELQSDNTLLNNLHLLQLKHNDEPRLLHRLDQNTTGVLLIGRKPQATAAISTLFQHRLIQKTYLAVVVATPTMDTNNPFRNASGTWSSPHPDEDPVRGAEKTASRIRRQLKRAGLGHPPYQHGILQHLHAHELLIPSYFTDGTPLHIVAPLPSHMSLTLGTLFNAADGSVAGIDANGESGRFENAEHT
ncbi:hypothetical protein PTSG_06069 [Salpingoeca rosetta]|uniref:Pseudouridylate synthase RPUSD4, mitochondrial n=1 Tax=Salpingoeca rosetta (strain ATCC 50818 / BSB-021) TaxID=946362 RepID=F2UDL3_SALR5|nr:uncharacterized protein PTSG_06069 [Salpingoeca rosetta]EGD74708.1 hypothetical protein PTSG_06069 [Salpingoeca rosetta]|eukprot:XP_004992965.1 hypothetical protein PTSG_06069 [Salpingoeca rosetta]